jgi:hydrogenase nickel incorporation protein HypA/HybF
LKLETIPAVTYCSGCEKTYETIRYGKICPYCGSPETWLVQGNECVIKEIEAE